MYLQKLLKILKKPFFAIGILVLAVISLAAASALPRYSYLVRSGKIQFEGPENVAVSAGGWLAVVDNHRNIFCLNEDKKLIYALNVDRLSYENAEFMEAVFGEDNHLYCHVAVYAKDAYLTEYEVVLELDAEGNIVRELLRYDYTKSDNPPSHQVQMTGLRYNEGRICYLYREEDGIRILETDIRKTETREMYFLPQEGYAKIIKCHGLKDGSWLILKNNGEIGWILQNGEYVLHDKAVYDMRTGEGTFPYDVFAIGERLYMLAGQEHKGLYLWKNESWEMVHSAEEAFTDMEDDVIYLLGMGQYDDSLILNINENLYLLDEKENLQCYNGGIPLPFFVNVCIWFKKVLYASGLVLLPIALVLIAGGRMQWRLSVLSRQLLVTVPVVLVMLIVTAGSMFISMADLYSNDIVRETIAINEIAAAMLDGDALDRIRSYESVDDGSVEGLNQQLRDFVKSNRSDWSKNYSSAVYVRTSGEHFVLAADSDETNGFMVKSLSMNIPVHEDFYENSHTAVNAMTYGKNKDNLLLLLETPIYKEDGSYDALMVLTAIQESLTVEMIEAGKHLLIHIVIWVAVLIVVISLLSAYNVRFLRQAKNVISQIAGGDFSVRVERFSKDEVGEICAGVNNMADRLEEYFEEKNKNEQFYYKFVPEKFRELLHKEKFTDLVLGDARSEDLTILFCDIRAFSLNSEMMTTKESFDFVNRIYGKAGPIIRAHHGFVDKYIGDAVMALFESADDAVAAGIALYHELVENPNVAKELNIHDLNIGIGIHSGMARIGIVGEKERMSGTVISNTVNLSSRLESLTKQYGTGMLISKDTLDRMENPEALTLRYLGMVQVAGVNEVVSIYEVLNCLFGDKRKKREQTGQEFREAVRLFHSGKLKEALTLFQEVAAADDEDFAAKHYVQYVEARLMKGDMEHNVFRFEKK
ncbi:MAG: adenylate/guanylate cyclase domain-containing protein [Lachnospiraceae bacterium]|nr:adenylate/guanylate cyclase domain-containing protein [Lachnospiraceae bacterium]